MSMGEDGLRNRKDNGPGNLAAMRKPTLGHGAAGRRRTGEVHARKPGRAGREGGFLSELSGSAASLAPAGRPDEVQMREPCPRGRG